MQIQPLKEAAKDLSSNANGAFVVDNHVLVQQKYSDEGELLTPETIDLRVHLKKLHFQDWQFLNVWRENNWNFEKACEILSIDRQKALKIKKKVDFIQAQEAKDKALASIPSVAFIQARHVENIYSEEKLDDSTQKSLDALAKIQGAYKTQATQVNNQINVLQFPSLDEETARKIKELADSLADRPIVQEARLAA